MSRRLGLGLLAATQFVALPGCERDPSPSAPQVFLPNQLPIGPEGGILETNTLSLHVQQGALSDVVQISVKETFAAAVPPGLILIGPAFDLSPDGTQFAKPVEIVVNMSRARLGAEPPVLHSSSDGETFEPVPDSNFDESSLNLTGSISHFSTVAAFVTSVGDGG